MTNTTEFKIILMRRGLTAEQLADLVGMSRVSLSYKMNNKRTFDQAEIKAISDALGLTLEEKDKIFFGDMVDDKSTTG